MSTQKERPSVKMTGRTYDSVTALMRGEGVSEKVQQKFRQLAHETQIALQLAELRQKAGITQAQMAEALGVSQSAISKLEGAKDETITLKEIREYSRVTQERIGLMFGKPLSPTEAVQAHANALKFWLDNLAEMANQNPELQSGIKALLGDTFYSLFNIIALCNEKLPITADDCIEEIRMEVVNGKSGKSAAPASVPSVRFAGIKV